MDYNKEYVLPYVRTGDIEPYNSFSDKSDIMIMTGASSNHAVSLLSCLLSFARVYANSSILFVDYGMTSTELCCLNHLFSIIHQFHLINNATARLYYRKYNWSVFPDWMNINETMLRGGYTWKPIAIADAFFQWKGVIMWNDAGNYYYKGSQKGIEILRKEGAFIPQDTTRYSRNMHNQSYDFLVTHKLIHPFNKDILMGRAGFMLFDYWNNVCRYKLMIPWLQCAYTRRCMAPIGSTIRNHLPEQTVISILATQNGMVSSCNTTTKGFSARYWTDAICHTLNNTLLLTEMQFMSTALGKEMHIDSVFGVCQG